MSAIVSFLWQFALILIAICVIMFFLPIAIVLLETFVGKIFGDKEE